VAERYRDPLVAGTKALADGEHDGRKAGPQVDNKIAVL
jgi:hypothetical protein